MLLSAAGVAWTAWQLLGRLRAADLAGEVALVTGGTRGLGFILAGELARIGCPVAILGRDGPELERAEAELRGRGADVLGVACDVSDRDQVEQAVRAATERFGRVDILINNAGIISVGPFDALRVEDFRRALDVMYWGVVYPTLAVLPQMRARGSGRIATITSIGGKISVPHLLPYSSAKFAAVGFSEGLRAELAGTGVTVTTIVPGLMRTGSHLNASFLNADEYPWFALGASLPGVSMDAERAARQIVGAIRRGDAECTLSLPAVALATLHGVAPGLTIRVLGLVDRFVLPAREAPRAPVSGKEAEQRLGSPALDKLTTLGQRAAERYLQT
jgi:NAD(P)-dependent dehydrogenase (short-subunit alcohol dehydrogenase family)